MCSCQHLGIPMHAGSVLEVSGAVVLCSENRTEARTGQSPTAESSTWASAGFCTRDTATLAVKTGG